MTYTQGEYEQLFVFNSADESVVPDTILAELAEFWPMQRFSDAAWIVEFPNALVKEFQNAPRYVRVELVERAGCLERELNLPGHVSLSGF